MGWLLKEYHTKVLKILKSPILLSIVLLILSLSGNIILRYSSNYIKGDYLITTFPLAVSLLSVAIKYPMIGKDTFIAKIGAKYSTDVYIFHLFILRVYIATSEKIVGLPFFTRPFIIFMLTLLFIIIWKKSTKKLFQ